MKQIRARYPWLRTFLLTALISGAVVIAIWLIWSGYSQGSTSLLVAGIFLAVVIAIWFIRAGYSYKWTGFGEYKDPSPDGKVVRAKTLWDWLQLFIIPTTLLLGGYLLNSAQKERESNISQLSLQETTLQTYLDQMANLLIDKELSSEPKPETKRVARVRTLTVVRRVNGEQKGIVLQFLYESNLIQGDDPVVSLTNVDLSEAKLTGAELRETDLRGAELSRADFREATLIAANLSGADLEGADLIKANLYGAYLIAANLGGAYLEGAYLEGAYLNGVYLSGANLSGANLSKTDLSEANLSGADLEAADLSGANLSGANFSGANLEGTYLIAAKYTKETKWPDGFDPAQTGAVSVESP